MQDEQGNADGQARPRLLQEQRETLQRLRLGGPFYVLLWLLAGTAGGLWQRAPVPFVLVAVVFTLLALARYRIRGLPADASQGEVTRRLDRVWALLLVNATVWGLAIAWLLLGSASESARTVAAVASYAFCTAFAHNFPMRQRLAFAAVMVIGLPTLGAFVANGSRIELILVGALYLLYVSLALRRSHQEYLQRLDLEDELRRQRDLYEQQSRRDGLTGLANRRRFSAVLEDWSEDAQRRGSPLALLLLDLDHFKAVNDQHGHAVGDACLRAFAAELQEVFSDPGELVARLGGEEFAVLLRECPPAQAVERAESFRRLREQHAGLLEGAGLDALVSIGVAVQAKGHQADASALYRAADAALYRAKRAGRNRVRLAEAED
jgi:diguanylate cyclase (GGDEF)-like protein